MEGDKPMEHTKGPWEFRDISSPQQDDGLGYIEGPDGLEILHHGSNRKSKEENLANAARIVACVNACEGINPEAVRNLLEACKAVIKEVGESIDASSKQAGIVLDALHAAIAKAEGKTDG